MMFIRRKEEVLERLALEVVDKCDDMIVVLSKDGEFIDGNEQFFKRFLLDDKKDFDNYYGSLRELFFWEEHHDILNDKIWLEFVAKKEEPTQVKMQIRDKISDFYLRVDESENGKFYIVSFKDVTELFYYQRKAAEFDNLKSNFLANISHEFRTPMNGILGFLELLNATKLTPKQHNYLEMIGRSSRVLMNNIEALLDFSQLQSKRLSVHKEYVELLKEVEAVVTNFHHTAKETERNFYTFIDPSLPKEVFTDIRKIRQILNALIDNALKFTHRNGTVVVEVRLRTFEPNGKCTIDFKVRDNGIGIAQNELESLFEPFTSKGIVDKRLGIGLALASGLTKLLGSKLEVDSEPNKGSTFSFSITTKGSKERSFAKIHKNKKARVIQVDPKRENNANILVMYLRAFGFEAYKTKEVHANVLSGIDLAVVVGEASETLRIALEDRGEVSSLLFLPESKRQEKVFGGYYDGTITEPLIPSNIYEAIAKLSRFGLDAPLITKREQVGKKLHALVVEDNLINQKLLKTILEEKGIEVDIANDGEEGVQKALLKKYDLIFMDIDLPKKSGIEATKEIKTRSSVNKNTPIIAQTAMAMDGDKERLLHAGLDGYMPKPIKRDILQHIIEAYGNV